MKDYIRCLNAASSDGALKRNELENIRKKKGMA
jgi:hypothetical protein